MPKTFAEVLDQVPNSVRNRYKALDTFLRGLGNDVQVDTLKHHVAYKHVKNFACIEIRPQKSRILVFSNLDPTSMTLEPGFTRDVRSVGHFGTGDLEISIESDDDFDRARALLKRAYETSRR
jgi:predicted transport protein